MEYCPLREKRYSGCHDFHGHLEIGLLLLLMKRLKKRSSRDLFMFLVSRGLEFLFWLAYVGKFLFLAAATAQVH